MLSWIRPGFGTFLCDRRVASGPGDRSRSGVGGGAGDRQ